MSCMIEPTSADKQTAILTFNREQLLYDIKNASYVQSHAMVGDNGHKEHLLADICEGGNSDIVTREIDRAIGEVREALYAYTKCEVVNSELDNALHEVPSYGVVLQLPKDFSQTTLNLMERYIHDYIVASVIYMWLNVTQIGDNGYWQARRDGDMVLLQRRVQHRSGKIRRKLQPF